MNTTGDIEHADVDDVALTDKAKEHAEAEKRVGRFLESLDLEQSPLLLRLNPHPHHGHGKEHCTQADEAQHPRRPPKPNLRIQLAEHDGVNNATETRPRRGDPVRQSAPFREVLWQDRDGRHEQASVANTDADRLREQGLPVLRAQGGHHEAEGDEDGTRDDELAEITFIIEWSGHDADEHEEEGLDGADPTDGRGGLVPERVGLVVRLEHTEGVDRAPRC